MRKGLAALVAAVALLGAGAALAAYRTGSYAGRTAQRLSITFHAGTRSVTGLTYAVRYRCSTGRRFTGSPLRDSLAYRIRYDRFGGTSRSPSGATRSEVHGTLYRSTATGTVRRTIRINTLLHRPDLAGDERCDSGTVSFTAHRPR